MSRVRMSAWSLVAAAACWGTATAISKRAVEEIPPLTLLPIELCVSVAVLLAASAVSGHRSRPSRHRRQLGWLGVLSPGVAYALSLAGLSRITASSSALLWATEPLLILLLAWVLLRQRPTKVVGVCAGFALAGVVLVVAQPDVRASTTGVLLTIAGVAACAVYTVVSSRYLADESTLGVVLIQQAFSARVRSAPAGGRDFARVRRGASRRVRRRLGECAGCGCAVLRGRVLVLPAWAANVLAISGGLFINLVLVFGVGSAALLLGERLARRQWIGVAVTVSAVTALGWTHTRRADEDDGSSARAMT